MKAFETVSNLIACLKVNQIYVIWSFQLLMHFGKLFGDGNLKWSVLISIPKMIFWKLIILGFYIVLTSNKKIAGLFEFVAPSFW